MYDLSGELTVILITILWLQKLGKDCQLVNKQYRNFMWKDLISRSSMSCKLGNSMRLRSQTGLQIWTTYNDRKGIIGLGRTLKGISKPKLKTVYICTN